MSCIFGQAHCINVTSNLLLCSYAYAVATMFSLYTHVRRTRIKEHGHYSYLVPVRRVRYFPLLLCISFLTRATWFVLVDIHAMQSLDENGVYANVLVFVPWFDLKIDLYPLGVLLWNKLSTLIYVTAFTLLLQFWSDMLAHTKLFRPTSSAIVPVKRRNLLVIANVWMYVIELMLLLTKSFTWETWFFNWDNWYCALIFFALSFTLV
ncbi:hypothetical protein THRCLA_10316 [Thraustotheca clavata]|uniref:Uncharacterized protein n=1 Tax=Thraustotheca clavata TaxID=74557 RepID=A0A1V9YRX5_9STRA|nr:hypothetical protein THRCLA_10316 [Thraustotheca clavata]